MERDAQLPAKISACESAIRWAVDHIPLRFQHSLRISTLDYDRAGSEHYMRHGAFALHVSSAGELWRS